MKKLMILLATALLFGACGSNDDNDEIPKEAERTVLIYIAADNNLSPLADLDLEELKEGSKKLGKQQNLIVFVDLANTTLSYIARIKDGVLLDSTSMTGINAADPAILEEMLRYTRETYPAKSYGLGLWGHSNGWIMVKDTVTYARSRAYGQDNGQDKSYWMNIPSMARAIANGMGNDKLRFIFADCCNFACIESAYELRNVTDYLIGSPAEIPEPGAPYHLIIPTLFNTSETFYESVINTYYDYYIEEITAHPDYYFNDTSGDLAGYSVPLSVIKSAELDNLAQETARLLGTIYDKLTPEGSLNSSDALAYGCQWDVKYHIDMFHILSLNTAESDFNKWKSAFLRAVPHRHFSRKWLTIFPWLKNNMNKYNMKEDECGMVSMFFPNPIFKSTNGNWNTEIRSFQWNDVIRWQDYGW